MAFSFNGNTPKVITFNNQDVKKLIWGNTVVWEKQKLPSQYQEVEYIEGTGTQYIDTGYYPNQDTKFEMRYYILEAGCSPGGVRWSVAPNSQTFGFFVSTSVGTTCYFGRANDNKYVTFANKNEYSQIADGLLDITRVSINTFSATVSRDQFVSTFPMYLFSLDIMGEASSPSKMRLYSASISESGAVKREFIPCYRKIDKKPGLYDAFNDVFYTNDGTGEFNVGPDIITIPDEYQRVEYIQGTSYTDGANYINTLEYAKNTTRMELVCEITGLPNKYERLYGVRGAFWSMQYGSTSYRFYIDKPNRATLLKTQELSSNTEYVIVQDGGTTYLNRTQIASSVQTFDTETDPDMSYAPDGKIWLNADNGGDKSNSHLKIKSCIIWQNGVLTKHFIPCYRKSDDVIGLYDLVSKQFYTNQGTGTFLKGKDVN